MKVQESSANLMKFLVQDLLDFAQIKSGKFRKNISKFNIREAIEQVMCIQRQQAMSNKIRFYAKYINISDRSDYNEDSLI